MQYVGSRRVKGEKDGNAYDFYEIYALERGDEKYAESGFKPYEYYSKKHKRVKYPAISRDNYDDCVNNGLRINSEIAFNFANGVRTMCIVNK